MRAYAEAASRPLTKVMRYNPPVHSYEAHDEISATKAALQSVKVQN